MVPCNLVWNVNKRQQRAGSDEGRGRLESEEYSLVLALGISSVSADVGLQRGVLFRVGKIIGVLLGAHRDMCVPC